MNRNSRISALLTPINGTLGKLLGGVCRSVGLAVLALPLWAQSPTDGVYSLAPDSAFQALQGSWQVTKATMNAQETREPALVEGRWTIEGHNLTVQLREKGTAQFALKTDSATQSAAIRVTPVQPINGGSGWMLFSREGDLLRIAYFDNLEGRPDSFETRDPLAKPVLIVLTLLRIN